MVDDSIKKYGYHMTFVFSQNDASYCYSTGIYNSFGIPEIFISSLPQNLSFELIRNYVDMFAIGKRIPIDARIDNLTNKFPVRLVNVANDRLLEYVLSSIRFYSGQDFKYLQLIFPDTKGLFPNDNGYNYDQVIIGEFKN